MPRPEWLRVARAAHQRSRTTSSTQVLFTTTDDRLVVTVKGSGRSREITDKEWRAWLVALASPAERQSITLEVQD